MENPKQLGNPDWNRFGLDKTRTYVVELCQEPSGRRYTKYRDVETGSPDTHAVLETESATGARFVVWGFYTYANHLRLSDGSRFDFDAHGVWLTHSEMEFLASNSTGPWESGPWVNGIPPAFAPK